MNASARACAIFVALSLMGLLTSCAQTGAPQPPSLELPKPPSDLRALRKGNSVILSWSEPTLTTDHDSVRYLGPTLICRGTELDMTACGNPLGSIPAPTTVPKKVPRKSKAKPPAPETYRDTLSSNVLSDSPEADLTYAVEVLNRNARSGGLSNRVHVPAIRTLPPPTDIAAQLGEDGVSLSWTSLGEQPARTGLEIRYRIYRREEGTNKESIAAEVPLGAAGPAHFLDAIEWEKTYVYRITAVDLITRSASEVQVEGDDSAPVRVVAHDIFPPAVPSSLQAEYSGEGQKPFIDLIWAPVASADLAGYNVYRKEGDAAAVKVNGELVKTPSYRDSAIASGKSYIYSVSAVDVRGNESARSEEASESVP
jgi:hypothetical protein